jgi:DNA-binding NarL/FixJ family response regulator
MELDDEELALVRLLADGLVLEAIARRLALSERTVRRRIRALCDRFDVNTPVQVVVIAARQGIV